MVKKIVGYFIALVGVLLIAITSFKQLKDTLIKVIPLPSVVTDTYLLIAGGILVVVGLLLSMKGRSSKQPSEVPIYHENKIVGFRRMGK